MDWLKCNICFNTYNDSSLRPRSLSCGHTFCERCLANTIQNKTLTCPQCRKILEINSVVDLPINFIVEGLLKSLNPCSQDVSEEAISIPIEGECVPDDKGEMYGSLKSILEQDKCLSAQKELLKTSAGMCYDHPCNELIFRCSSHKSWVCEKCIEERGDHPKHYCTITSFQEEIEDRKQEHKIYLDNEEKSCNETILVIEKHISYMSNKREHHISLVNVLQDLMNVHKKEDKNMLSEIKSFEKVIKNGKIVKQKLLDVKDIVLNAGTLDESNEARDMVENKKEDARDWVKKSDKELNEGKLNVQTSSYLEMETKILEYREKFKLMQEELEETINQSEQNKPLENIIISKDIEFMRKNESRISEATNDVCKAHHKVIGHQCLNCKRWLCDCCLKSHTTVRGCSTISASTAVRSMKDEHTKSTDLLLSVFEEDTNHLFSKIQKINDKIQEITDKRKELLEEAKELAKELKNINNLLEQGKKQKENLVKSKNHLCATNSPNAISDRIEVLEEMKQAFRSWSITNLGMNNIYLNIPYDARKALKEKRDVYVEMVVQGQRRHGKLSQHTNKIYFHTFRAQAETHGCIFMPFDHLQKLIPASPSLVFLELSLAGTVKGRVLLRLEECHNIREHMVQLVTGQKEHTLAGIALNEIDDDSIKNLNLPFSNMPVTPDSSARYDGKRGDVKGYYQNGCLKFIYFQIAPHGNSTHKIIGSITDGMDIIQECYNNYHLGVVISDCGLVL